MTSPERQRIDAHDRQALSFEQQAAAAISAPIRRQLEQANRQIAAAYLATTSSLDLEVPEERREWLIRRIIEALAVISIRTRRRLLQYAQRGVQLGLDQAGTVVPTAGIQPAIPPSLLETIEQLDGKARADLQSAITTARTTNIRDWADVLTVQAQAAKAANRVDQNVRWVANRAVAEGTTQAAAVHNAPRVWVAERDACLACLAYAGQVAAAGEPFPSGLTFGDRVYHHGEVWNPPLHPNCRCRSQVWLGSLDGVGPFELPAVLHREALRSVLTGEAGASEPARVRAADRLLRAGVGGVPRSVLTRAERAVRDSSFDSVRRRHRPRGAAR